MTAVRCSRVGMTATTHERMKFYVLVKYSTYFNGILFANLKQPNDGQPKTCIYLSVGWSLIMTTVAQHALSCVQTDPQGC